MMISICIITIQRQDYLKKLLVSIHDQNIAINNINCEVIVVDNDGNPTSESVVNELCSAFDYPLRYVHQPERGIPQARNTAVQATDPNTEFILFVDDDQFVDSKWVSELLRVQKETNADVVGGPVFPVFKEEVPKWVVDGKFFLRSKYDSFEDGGEVHHRVIKTNNVLIRKSMLDKLDGPFNESMALTGGTDTVMAISLKKLGAKMVWAKHAVAKEWIPASRATKNWIYSRAFRTANTELIFRYVEVGKRQKIKIFVEGILRLIYGITLWPIYYSKSKLKGKHVLVRHNRLFYRGFGMITSCFGHRFEEYKTIHK
jgi:succinoglycan biosynthesis protein ExoM